MGVGQLLFALLTPRERRSAGILMGLMILNALVEAIGVLCVLPLLTVLNDPGVVAERAELQWLLQHLAWGSTARLPILLSTLTLFILLFNSAVRIGTEYAIARFVEMRRHSLSVRLLTGYLRQSWAGFLGRNSTELTRAVLSDVDTVIQSGLLPGLRIPVYALVVVSLIGVLLLVNPLATAVAGTLVVGTYLVSDTLSRRRSVRLGAIMTQANRGRFSTIGQALGGAKTLKLLGREDEMIRRFAESSQAYCRSSAAARTAAVVPRFAVEGVAIGGLVLWLIVRLRAGVPLADTLPLIGLYAFAGYRLMPACQQVFAGLSLVRFGMTASRIILAELQAVEAHSDRNAPRDSAAIELHHTFALDQVSFRYPGAAHQALAHVSLLVRAGETVALAGPSGAGKSTVVDLLLGLLTPDAGHLVVDGRALSDAESRAWGRALGYVPQHPFFADDTVLANVAFGLAPQERNRAAALRAITLAGLSDVIDRLPNGLDSGIGERGQNLSGGERQRLAVARALYLSPQVLIFDEATSAVDQGTTDDLLVRLRALSPRPAIVLVSHDPSVLVHADRTIHLQEGRVL